MSGKSKVLSGLAWKFSERISAQLITFVVSILLARILSTDEYGTIALLNVFIAITNTLIVSGFGSALIQKKDADNTDFTSVFYFNIFTSLLLYSILFITAPIIGDFFRQPILVPTLRVLGIRLILSGVNSVQEAYVAREMLFKKFFFSTLIGTLISGILGLTAAYYNFGIWSLVIQNLSNYMINTIILWFTVKWRPHGVISFMRIKNLLSFGWKVLVSALLDTGYIQVRNLIIGGAYSVSDLAYYNRGEQIPNLVITNINSSISSVLFPAISSIQDNKESVKSMTRRAIKTSALILLPVMVGLIVLAKPITVLLLTEKWLPSVKFMQIACIVYAFYPIHTANLQAINAVGRSDVFLKLEIIKKTFGAVLIFVSAWYGVIGIALSGIVISFVSSIVNAYPNKKVIDYGYMEQLRDIMPAITLSVLMGLIIYPIKFFIDNNLGLIFIQAITGVAFYSATCYLLKIEGFIYILNIIQSSNKKVKK